ncbi:GerAB/ArcD/ProY family transporter [Paenibacillus sp. URB8-2]|uniref:GerAB/ArcD/ProY family transporter n=1 Tax=Paenibacillus sp. URB8-2 TaxID=2741301 RepID=UPI001E3F2928|nr:GerAB/ArcD/ProY family transporter [Paenibacillus sp. URB8-2]
MLIHPGNAILISIGTGAKQDAWLAVLLGMLIGVAVFGWIYGPLYHMFPTEPITSLIRKAVGTRIGWLIGFAYMTYFAYISSRNLRDFGELLISSTYDETPLLPIQVLMMLSLAYLISRGVEVFARTTQIFCFILLLFILASYILIILSGLLDVNRLLPVLGNGFMPVIHTAFPLTYTFPFGEMIAFLMLLPYVKTVPKTIRTASYGIALSGLLISLTISMNIAILGSDIVSRATFPTYTAISKVNIAEILQRLDVLVLLSLIISSYFKIGTFYFAAVLAASDLFKITYNKLAVTIGLCILFSSMIIANNFSEHLEEGLIVIPPYFHLPFQAGIPLLLLIILKIRFRHR